MTLQDMLEQAARGDTVTIADGWSQGRATYGGLVAAYVVARIPLLLFQAVQAALSKVSTLLLDNHLRTCVTTAIQGDDAEERERMLQEITSVFTVTGKK